MIYYLSKGVNWFIPRLNAMLFYDIREMLKSAENCRSLQIYYRLSQIACIQKAFMLFCVWNENANNQKSYNRDGASWTKKKTG